jgi:antitoxin component of MazEF toxin-antitoxin module
MTIRSETRRVVKQGNSLMIGIPAGAVETMAIREGDRLTFEVDGGDLIYRKRRRGDSKNFNAGQYCGPD